MKLPFPLNRIFIRSTASVMGHFTKMVDELETIAEVNLNKANAVGNKAESALDEAKAKAEKARAYAEAAMVDALALADEREEADIQKIEAIERQWEAYVNESNEARAAAVNLRRMIGSTS